MKFSVLQAIAGLIASAALDQARLLPFSAVTRGPENRTKVNQRTQQVC